MRLPSFACVFIGVACSVVATTGALPAPISQTTAKPQQSPWLVLSARTTCKQVNSCEEAVQIWCDGYARADADDDGIPCENICHSKEQVDEIRRQIGC
nr:excalibur calcium-binding domain-containing protein [Phyllobacterium ifriqiyense]